MSRNLTIPRPTDPSLLEKDPLELWEPYIASNLYLYLVPLAVFLRRARELDFSVPRFERSIRIVQRVFRVYTPALVKILAKYLNKCNDSYLVTNHERNLGSYGPPSSSLSLQSFKFDVQSLLEEIDVQHTKKVNELNIIDRYISWAEGLFGHGVVSGEEKILDHLIERAKIVCQLSPEDESIVPRSRKQKLISGRSKGDDTTNDNNKNNNEYRNPDGTLTDFGRQQLLIGAWKCNIEDVRVMGDPLYVKVQNHEISWLVDVTVAVSDYLNEYFQLTSTTKNYETNNGTTKNVIQDSNKTKQWYSHYRFNLRFLADYRNLLFGYILYFFLTRVLL